MVRCRRGLVFDVAKLILANHMHGFDTANDDADYRLELAATEPDIAHKNSLFLYVTVNRNLKHLCIERSGIADNESACPKLFYCRNNNNAIALLKWP